MSNQCIPVECKCKNCSWCEYEVNSSKYVCWKWEVEVSASGHCQKGVFCENDK